MSGTETDRHAGVVGLGRFGTAVARRLTDEGVSLSVWNRTPEKGNSLPVDTVDHPRDTLKDASVVLVCLPDGETVQKVMSMGKGLLKTDLSGAVVVDMTTQSPPESEQFHRVVDGHGGYYLETPAVGRPRQAREGSLLLYAGGDREALEHARPILNPLARNIVHTPDPGRASTLVLLHRLLEGGLAALLGETLLLGTDTGVERKRLLEHLQDGVLHPDHLASLLDDFRNPRDGEGFGAGQMAKEMNLVENLADRRGRPLPLGAMARQRFRETRMTGDETGSLSVLLEVLDR